MSDLKSLVNDTAAHFYEKKNVVGVAVGTKYTNGQDTGEQALLVFVEKKEDKSILSANDIIESSIMGVRTDVVGRSGVFSKHANTTPLRPVMAGTSCGHMAVTAGTIGGFFRDRDGHIVALSNNHVLANEAPFYQAVVYNAATGAGHIVIQPGIYDKGNLTHRIGQLKSYAPLTRTGNLQDSATMIFQSENWGVGSPWYRGVIDYNPVIKDIGELNGWNDDPTINLPVQKSGRTTGYTTGKIIGLHATMSIQYDYGTFIFTDQIVTTNMSQGGDSGSLLLDMNRNAVGLLFAGSSSFTLHNPIKYPREYYGLSIINSTPITETSAINVVTLDGQQESAFSIDGLKAAIENAKIAARAGHETTIEVMYNVKPQ